MTAATAASPPAPVKAEGRSPFVRLHELLADIKPVGRAFAEHAPERCVWGSDWPHPTEPHAKPDDAALLDLFLDRLDSLNALASEFAAVGS